MTLQPCPYVRNRAFVRVRGRVWSVENACLAKENNTHARTLAFRYRSTQRDEQGQEPGTRAERAKQPATHALR